MTIEPIFKTAATVADVARLVGLSRARFYQLMQAEIFPLPVYEIHSRRPCYTEEQQRVCLEVRKRNCGINGKAVMFYARRLDSSEPRPSRKPKRHRVQSNIDNRFAQLTENVQSLGLTSVNATQVQAAVRQIYPQGITGIAEGEVIRAVFVHIKRQNSADNVGR